MDYTSQKYHRSVRNVAMVCVAAVALGSSTYAWFVSNIKVDATTTNISAQSNSAYLVIEAGSATTTNSRTSATGTEKTTGNDTALYPAQWKNNFDASGNSANQNGVYQFESAYATNLDKADEQTGTRFKIGDPATAVGADDNVKTTNLINLKDCGATVAGVSAQ